jgi:hypothetical protein
VSQFQADPDEDARQLDLARQILTSHISNSANQDVSADRKLLEASTLGAGTPNLLAQPVDERTPGQRGMEAFNARMAQGARREDASAEVLTRIIDAAVKGDERVLINNVTQGDANRAAMSRGGF